MVRRGLKRMILDHRAGSLRRPVAVSTWSSREPDLLLLFLLFRLLHFLRLLFRLLLQGKKDPSFRWYRFSFVPRQRATDPRRDRSGLLVRPVATIPRDNPVLPSRRSRRLGSPDGDWKIDPCKWLFERKTGTTMMTILMMMTTTTMNGPLIEAEDEEA